MEITPPKIHSGHIEVAVSVLLDYRTNLIVPNVSYGWGLAHEADLIVVTPSNKVTEVEIKISRSDLLIDLKKPKHKKTSKVIGRLVYAIPTELKDVFIENFPKEYGLITVEWNSKYGVHEAKWDRMVRYNKEVLPITDKKKMELQRLGCMRVWDLKRHNNRPKK